MAKITFHVVINEEDDGSYWAEVKELPGCFASGFSLAEVEEAMNEAIQLWLPDGIALDIPKWKMLDGGKDSGSSVPAKKRKHSSAKRKMLVCA